MKMTTLIFLLSLILLNVNFVFANDGDAHGGRLVFPAWTYYAEIVEHSLMIIISIAAILLLINPYKTYSNEAKDGILWMIIGLGIFIFAQLITNLHHFLIFPFGIWNAVIHHGLYVISIIVIIAAFFKAIEKFK